MKPFLLMAAFALALFSSAAQASNFDFGVGIGPSYSGVGVSSKYFPSSSSAFGVSAGCVLLTNIESNKCGFGVSYERIGFFSAGTNKNALGLYVGIVDTQMVLRNQTSERENVYGASLLYNYYFRGFGNSGFHIGAHVTAADQEPNTDITPGLTVGYRF